MTYYNTGAASVAAGGKVVSFTGAGLGSKEFPFIKPGELFFDPAQPLVPGQRIASVDYEAQTATLWVEWPGISMVSAPYEVRLVDDAVRSTRQSRRYIEMAGQLTALGIQPNAFGQFSDRAAFDDAAKGFIFLSLDGDGVTGVWTLYTKLSATSGDWSTGQQLEGREGRQGDPGNDGGDGQDGADGNDGWTPVLAIVNDGARRVHQVVDWVGGEGTKPATGSYVGAAGLTATIGDAIDIRGPAGAAGAGTGDMQAGTYDPQDIAADAFDRANHTGTQAISTVSGLQTALDAKALQATTYTKTEVDALVAAGGGGDVVGPAAAGDAHIAVFDGTSGKLLKDGGKTLAEIVPIAPPQGRLTLVSLTPVAESDVAGAASIYYAAAGGSLLPIYDGADFVMRNFGAQVSLALDSVAVHSGYHQSGKNFDLFAVWQGGSVVLGTGPAWSSDVARGSGAGSTEIEIYRGLIVNKQAITLRFGTGAGDTISVLARQATYLGSFRATADGQASDTKARRLLFNAYNQVVRAMRVSDPAASWTYSVAAWRQTNGSPANQLEFLLGLSGIGVSAQSLSMVNSSTATPRTVRGAIGLDSTTTIAPDTLCNAGHAFTGNLTSMFSVYSGFPGLGRHALTQLEYGGGADSQTWFGTDAGGNFRSGLTGSMLG